MVSGKGAKQLGTDATTVSRWERGLFSPTPYFRERLCGLFNTNTEELGLLEPIHVTPTVLERSATHMAWRASRPLYSDDMTMPIPPSWPERKDTFTYILDSADHDQQAHKLWEQAYVQILHGQQAEAQQLGEASLTAFEHVGHLNATALREWLDQQGFVASQPPLPEGTLPQQHPSTRSRKRSFRQTMLINGTGLMLLMIIVAAFSFSAFASNLPSVPQAQQSATIQHNKQAKQQINPAISPIASPTAIATSTHNSTTVAGKPTPASPLAKATITPTSLSPQNCQQESLGYRCTLKLLLSANQQGAFSWHLASNSLAAQSNPSKGSSNSGQPSEVILYIQATCTQSGTFTFAFLSSGEIYTASTTWQC